MKGIVLQMEADSDSKGGFRITISDHVAHMPAPAVIDLFEQLGDRLHLAAQEMRTAHAEGRVVPLTMFCPPDAEIDTPEEPETGH